MCLINLPDIRSRMAPTFKVTTIGTYGCLLSPVVENMVFDVLIRTIAFQNSLMDSIGA